MRLPQLEVVNLEIADFPRFSPAYAACSRNSEGKAVIDELNKFIHQAVSAEHKNYLK